MSRWNATLLQKLTSGDFNFAQGGKERLLQGSHALTSSEDLLNKGYLGSKMKRGKTDKALCSMVRGETKEPTGPRMGGRENKERDSTRPGTGGQFMQRLVSQVKKPSIHHLSSGKPKKGFRQEDNIVTANNVV